MYGWLGPQGMNSILFILQRSGVRFGAMALAVPLSILGHWVLPGSLPPETLPELLRSNLGAVAAGLFLSFLGVLAATACAVGTIIYLMQNPGVRPFSALGMLLVGMAVLTGTLYLAGRALTWLGALWLLLMASGTLWGIGKWYPPPADGPPPYEL